MNFKLPLALLPVDLNKFAISNHTALILSVHALRSYSKLICEYELLIAYQIKKLLAQSIMVKNYIKVRPPLVYNLLHNRL